MPTTLSRNDVVGGLRAIVERLRTAGEAATIQLVGGVAISLTIDGDRPPTKDVDAMVSPPARVRAIANDVGIERGWPDGWLDEEAAIYLPNQFGRGEEWVTIYDADGIVIQVGSPRMLLAMKLLGVERIVVDIFVRIFFDLFVLFIAVDNFASIIVRGIIDLVPVIPVSARGYGTSLCRAMPPTARR